MLKSFLSDRKQCVKNGTTYSDQTELNYGVPQGAVSGPLVFILYVNDFREEYIYQKYIPKTAVDTWVL